MVNSISAYNRGWRVMRVTLTLENSRQTTLEEFGFVFE